MPTSHHNTLDNSLHRMDKAHSSLDNHPCPYVLGHKPRHSHLTLNHLFRPHMARRRPPILKDRQDITGLPRRRPDSHLILQPIRSHQCLPLTRVKHHHSNSGASRHLPRDTVNSRISNKTSGDSHNSLNMANLSSMANSLNPTANMFVIPHVILSFLWKRHL